MDMDTNTLHWIIGSSIKSLNITQWEVDSSIEPTSFSLPDGFVPTGISAVGGKLYWSARNKSVSDGALFIREQGSSYITQLPLDAGLSPTHISSFVDRTGGDDACVCLHLYL